jgi:hypothetical protein
VRASPLRELLHALIHEGGVTIVTTPGDAPVVEGGAIDAVTVIQLDGDVVTRIADPSRARAHLARLEAALAPLAVLRRWARAVRRLRLPVALAAQVPWLWSVARDPGVVQAVLSRTWAHHGTFLLTVALGLGGVLFHRFAPRLLARVVRAWVARLDREVWSGRPGGLGAAPPS